MIVTRFAPSPTGRLHVGNVRTALLNWLLARKQGGRFLLRLDDTDTARSTEEFAQSIRDDLAWLGMTPDAEEKQSARMARYEEVLGELAAAGHAYRAYETPDELDLKRKVLLGRGLPPVYDRAALALTEADHGRFAAEGRKPHWRFKLDPALPHEWTDLIRGPSRIDVPSLSDPVIRRADGSWLYMLPSVIDDMDMGVTHVVRGEDHVTNTGIQLQMFAAMRAEFPKFGHAALLTGADGALSKRLGSIGVFEFRDRGIEPIAVKALLARLGTSQSVEPVTSDAPLIEGFDITNLGRATARFDEADLDRLNAAILHHMPHSAVASRTSLTEAEWNAVRGNIASVADAEQWKSVIRGPITAPDQPDEDRAYLAAAAETLAGLQCRSLACVDRGAESLHRPQGQGPVRAAATGSDGNSDRARHGGLPAADRPRRGAGAAARPIVNTL
jgi:glutamyl-tRNA synthetase